MKKIKLLNILLTVVIFFNTLSVTATAQPDDELLDLYKTYSGDNTIIEINPTYDNLMYINNYNCYDVTKRLLDFCQIAIFTDTEIDMDLSELTDKMGYPPDMFSISYDFDEDKQFVKITFYTQEYDINSDIAKKLYNLLKSKYKIYYAYVYTYTNLVSETQAIVWDNFYLLDKFGYRVTTDEQLSKKQINRLRDEIIAGNFSDVADVDDDGKIIIYEQASDADKLRFALWLREKYGYYAKIHSDIGGWNPFEEPPSAETEILHYTELPGDVDNNNYVTYMDAKALQEYLLSGSTDYISDDTIRYQCFNIKNADLTGDGVIDVFDLVLLRKQLIDKF